MSNLQTKRVSIALEGSPPVVDSLVTLLRYIECCGVVGTTRFVRIMIDGDGGCQISVRIDDRELPLNHDEMDYLLEDQGEGTPALRALNIVPKETADGVVLEIDLV